jgi:hypothetical protein
LSELYYCLSRGEAPHFISQLIDNYLSVVRQNGESTNQFSQRILDGWTIIFNLYKTLHTLFGVDKARHLLDNTVFPKKNSWTGNSWGQLSLKEEAAGKLRVFAMVDNLTQSVLKPLHTALQDLLRLIPNDGTFDQDKSVERSAAKSLSSKCAFSFDLSAATDRLPVELSSSI